MSEIYGAIAQQFAGPRMTGLPHSTLGVVGRIWPQIARARSPTRSALLSHACFLPPLAARPPDTSQPHTRMGANPTMSERTPLLAASSGPKPPFGSAEPSPSPPPAAGSAPKPVHFLNLVNTCFLLSMAFAYTASTLYVEIRWVDMSHTGRVVFG